MDAWSRRIVGYPLSQSSDVRLTLLPRKPRWRPEIPWLRTTILIAATHMSPPDIASACRLSDLAAPWAAAEILTTMQELRAW